MAKPKIHNIKQVDTDSVECPQILRLPLRADIRYLFGLRSVTRDAVLSNVGIDAFLNLWWSNHRKIILAASFRPEWDWKTLSLNFDKQVLRPVNFYEAKKDYLVLLARPSSIEYRVFSAWNYSTDFVCGHNASDDNYLGHFHKILYHLFIRAFDRIILEGKEPSVDEEYTDDDAYVSVETVNGINDCINNHLVVADDNRNRGCFCMKGISKLLVDDDSIVPFNKLPRAIFNKINSLRSNGDLYSSFITNLEIYFNNYGDDFLADLYKDIRANQIANNKGPIKTTMSNKLVTRFYEWLTALTVGFSGNPFSLVDCDYDYYYNHLKEYLFYTDSPFKNRLEGREGFELVNRGTFDQLFARLQENCKGTFNRESFIISLHPCDMITCSLGYNWSSCQSWIDNFHDLPDGYGRGCTYGGQYSRGNFQFASGNGFIAYIPHERLEGVPQYLWAKKKRCLIWVGNNLDCIRQNDFYPGHQKDQESIALGKTIREYLQEVFAPFNFSNGTMDWKVKNLYNNHYSNVDYVPNFDKFEEHYDPTGSIRFDDPIFALSYLKTAVPEEGHDKPYLNYALMFPRFDTGIPHASYGSYISSFFSNTRGTCPICGKHTSKGGICPKCAKELVLHNGRKIHPSDLVTIKIGDELKSFDLDEIEQLNDYVVTEDGTSVAFKSAYKVFMPSGIKYFKELPDFVKQCRVCKEYFHQSFMIGDVCVDHFNTALSSASNDDVVVNIDEVLKAFMAGTLSFDCNDTDNLLALLRLLDSKGVTWLNGATASAYFPKTAVTKRMYLSLHDGKLQLSSKPLSTVVCVSKLFTKGGE